MSSPPSSNLCFQLLGSARHFRKLRLNRKPLVLAAPCNLRGGDVDFLILVNGLRETSDLRSSYVLILEASIIHLTARHYTRVGTLVEHTMRTTSPALSTMLHFCSVNSYVNSYVLD